MKFVTHFVTHFVTKFVREYLIAVQFFTRIPITGRLAGWVGFSPDLLDRKSVV